MVVRQTVLNGCYDVSLPDQKSRLISLFASRALTPMTSRSLFLLSATAAVFSVSCASDGEFAQVGDYRVTAFDGETAESRVTTDKRTRQVSKKTLANEFVVRTTAYTHLEEDSLPYGTKNAYGSELKFSRTLRSAAADWSRYPVGTVFKIKGLPYNYVVDDYGSALVGTDTIDLYKPSHAEMNAWGARNVGIEVIQWGSFDKSLEILDGRKGKAGHVDEMLGSIKRKIGSVPSELRNGFRAS